jgi:hypothetical protein
VGRIDHLMPFQRSASAPLLAPPTAMQVRAEVHDTPYRTLFVEPTGLGVG